MGGRIARSLGIFLAVGVLVALTLETLPYWAHLGILIVGVWLMFRVWDAGSERDHEHKQD